jgi:hypothetical protein
MAPDSSESNSCRCPRFAPIPQGAKLGQRQSRMSQLFLSRRARKRNAVRMNLRGEAKMKIPTPADDDPVVIQPGELSQRRA